MDTVPASREMWRGTPRALARLGLGHALVIVACLGVVLVGFASAAATLRDSVSLANEREAAAQMSAADRQTLVRRQYGIPAEFDTFRALLRPGDRFALIRPRTMSRDQAGLYQLFALYYLYPAIAVPDAARADAVLVFGKIPPEIRRQFRPVAGTDRTIWIGRRPR